MSNPREQKAAAETFLDAGESSARDISPKRRGIALMIASALLAVMGAIVVLYDGNLVWINRLEHPLIFGCIAAAAFSAGLVEFIRWRSLRFLVRVASGFVVLGWLAMGFFWIMHGGDGSQGFSVDAPGESDYKAVVEQNDVIDTLWVVYIRQTRGLLSREWRAACIGTDATATGPIDVVLWRGPGLLRIFTAQANIFISVDPRTGKPRSPIPITAREAC